MSVYLDHAATSPIRPEAADAMLRALQIGGNPSSVHARGRAARSLVEESRATVARFTGADVSRVAFTSGGTEADALAIESAAADGLPLIVGATEHDAVIETARATGRPVELWPVDANGVADLDWLRDRLKAGDRPFVALMLANNETGVIQPVAEAAALVREAGGRLHVDAVQAPGKIGIDLDALGADTLAISAHKLGGPQGAGALVWGERAVLRRRLHGGGQERGVRAGTENLSGIAGLAAACAAAETDLDRAADQAVARDAAAERCKALGAIVAGEGAPRLSTHLCLAVPDWGSELQVIALDLAGVMVSAGAACSSGKVRPSRVLSAMGLESVAGGALRATGGWNTRPADWDLFAQAWADARARFAARRSSRPAA